MDATLATLVRVGLAAAMAAAALWPSITAAQGKGTVFTPPPPPLPFALTATDGAGLVLSSLEAKVVIQEPLAFTEIHLSFHNPEDRVREGRFHITLPPGAAISRFAMRIGDRWQEGEVVERQAARVAFEDALHRRVDPALLEHVAGNEFSARVFPIGARQDKQLVVAYSQEMSRSDQPYRLPLRGLPRVGTLSVQARVTGGAEPVAFSRRSWVPDRDFEIAPRRSGSLGLRNGELVVARIRPLGESTQPRPIEGLVVLVDSSASRAGGFAGQVGKLGELMDALARSGDPQVTVAAFDQQVEPVFSGKASGFGAVAPGRLLARDALGASDLGLALAWVGKSLGKSAPGRLMLISDGIATAGETGGAELRARIKALGNAGLERIDVWAVGGSEDAALLAGLATALGPGRDGRVFDAAMPVAEIVDRLCRPTRSGVKLAVPGARWIWPSVLKGAQPGDEVLVYAELPSQHRFRLEVDGRTHVAARGGLETAERPLLERAAARAHISQLLEVRDSLAGDPQRAEALRREVIALSVRQRVLTPFTALLVLETEADYARFGIARRALGDILTVGTAGLTVLARRPVTHARIEAPPAPRPIVQAPPPAPPAPRPAPPAPPPASAARPPFVPRTESVIVVEKAPLISTTSANVKEVYDLEFVQSLPHESRDRIFHQLAPSAAPAAPVAAAPPLAVAMPANSPEPAQASDLGDFQEVITLLGRGRRKEALARAGAWRRRQTGEVLAAVALGQALEATGDPGRAARAYGSLIDLFPARADLRRFAGGFLERLGQPAALALAVDTFRKAAADRADHPGSHRLLAFALLRAGRPAEAFAVLEAAINRVYPDGRFLGADRILREDLGLAAAAWIRAEPARDAEIHARLYRAAGLTEDKPSLRFVLTWETDANDVDLHVRDGRNGRASYANPRLRSGGRLYADVTTGYGPECFTIRKPPAARAYPYLVQAHYFRRGPMGYGLGKLQVIDHDGHGRLHFEDHPYVVMENNDLVDVGTIRAPGALIRPRAGRPGTARRSRGSSGTGTPSGSPGTPPGPSRRSGGGSPRSPGPPR